MKLLPDSTVKRRYVNSGEKFADLMMSDIPSREEINENLKKESFEIDDHIEAYNVFKKEYILLKRLVKWEAEYARRGYRTISLDRFLYVDAEIILSVEVGQKRDEDEEPVLHARDYKKDFLRRIAEDKSSGF